MKVLVCPLDWGLGHAARCIPLIRALLVNGHQVVVGAGGGGKRLLEQELPAIPVYDFPGYQVRYSRTAALFLPVLALQLPAVAAGMLAEHRRLRGLLAAHRPDVVISDGRYGVQTRRLPCFFITHQIRIRVSRGFPGAAAAERLLLALNTRLLRRFREVWVPDFPGPANLSGALSHPPDKPALTSEKKSAFPANLAFIHPLSRFGGAAPPGGPGPAPDRAVDILAVVSGPEPQRSLFEEIMARELERLPGTRVLVRGLPGPSPAPPRRAGPLPLHPGGLNRFDHLDGPDLEALFRSAALVVARSGYTTVMELSALGKRGVVLVPTPGQSEQEYLADHLQAGKVALRMDQDRLDLSRAREALAGFSGFPSAQVGPDGRDFSLRAFIAAHPLFQTGSGKGS